MRVKREVTGVMLYILIFSTAVYRACYSQNWMAETES